MRVFSPGGSEQLSLPVDEDDYLQPKSSNPAAYVDLLDSSKGQCLATAKPDVEPYLAEGSPPRGKPSAMTPLFSMHNPEYFQAGSIHSDFIYPRSQPPEYLRSTSAEQQLPNPLRPDFLRINSEQAPPAPAYFHSNHVNDPWLNRSAPDYLEICADSVDSTDTNELVLHDSPPPSCQDGAAKLRSRLASSDGEDASELDRLTGDQQTDPLYPRCTESTV